MSGHASSTWRDWPFKAADTIAVGDQHSGPVGVAYSTDPELLRQCVASGQVEGDQIVKHELPEAAPVRCAGGRTQHTMEPDWKGPGFTHMKCRWCGKREAV